MRELALSQLALAQLALALADDSHGAAEDAIAGVVFAAGGGGRCARAPVTEAACRIIGGRGGGRRGGGREGLIAVPILGRPLAAARRGQRAEGGGGRRGRGQRALQLRLGARPLEAGVGGAQHLGRRHAEAVLRAAALL